MPTARRKRDATLLADRRLSGSASRGRDLGFWPALREVAVVLIVALAGLVVAAAIVLAPWHPAEAAAIVELLPPG